jgi:hypothetical protein
MREECELVSRGRKLRRPLREDDRGEAGLRSDPSKSRTPLARPAATTEVPDNVTGALCRRDRGIVGRSPPVNCLAGSYAPLQVNAEPDCCSGDVARSRFGADRWKGDRPCKAALIDEQEPKPPAGHAWSSVEASSGGISSGSGEIADARCGAHLLSSGPRRTAGRRRTPR